jgi:hypothetical protein
MRQTRFLVAYFLGAVAFGQTIPTADQPVVISVEGDNYVIYRGTTFDLTKIAKDQNPTTSAQTAFLTFVNVGDVRTVNGKPSKGLYTSQGPAAMPYRANPQPGQPISDMDAGGMLQCVWLIHSAEGKYIGTLLDAGITGADHIVGGGSGAFLGMTGIHLVTEAITPQRQAANSEDPSNRRIHGGGRFRDVFYLYPKTRPAVIATAGGAAVFHQDGKIVSIANPAQSGEVMTLYATGLGPTSPAVVFGQPFPQGTLCTVNAPVEIAVNGKASEVLYAGGFPGGTDQYQVNFRLPSDLNTGNGSLQLTGAWVAGPQIAIAIK